MITIPSPNSAFSRVPPTIAPTLLPVNDVTTASRILGVRPEFLTAAPMPTPMHPIALPPVHAPPLLSPFVMFPGSPYHTAQAGSFVMPPPPCNPLPRPGDMVNKWVRLPGCDEVVGQVTRETKTTFYLYVTRLKRELVVDKSELYTVISDQEQRELSPGDCVINVQVVGLRRGKPVFIGSQGRVTHARNGFVFVNFFNDGCPYACRRQQLLFCK